MGMVKKKRLLDRIKARAAASLLRKKAPLVMITIKETNVATIVAETMLLTTTRRGGIFFLRLVVVAGGSEAMGLATIMRVVVVLLILWGEHLFVMPDGKDLLL